MRVRAVFRSLDSPDNAVQMLGYPYRRIKLMFGYLTVSVHAVGPNMLPKLCLLDEAIKIKLTNERTV